MTFRLTPSIDVLLIMFNSWLQKKLSITVAQLSLLRWLSDQKEVVCMSKVAEIIDHTPAAATCLVDRLEKLGYVERYHANKSDLRMVHVRPTKLGIRRVRRASKKCEKICSTI